MLQTSELARKAKKIEILSRRLVDQQLASQYHSVFKGRGLIFSDVRQYYPGDDVRTIDWNITARMNIPHVKQFIEERDRTVNLVFDMSASGQFGSAAASKREMAAELAAVVAFSAIKNNDRVGLFILTDKVELYVRPKKGRKHVMRVISNLLTFKAEGRGTDLAAGIEFLGKIQHTRSVVFVVSDFLSSGWESAVSIASQKHEIVPVVVSDPMETALPAMGIVQFEDLETGEVVEIDTSGPARRDYLDRVQSRALERDNALRRLKLDVVEIQTDQPYVDALVAYFRARVRRMAHGG
jgi:uncharacterized protein (DUF58 family)